MSPPTPPPHFNKHHATCLMKYILCFKSLLMHFSHHGLYQTLLTLPNSTIYLLNMSFNLYRNIKNYNCWVFVRITHACVRLWRICVYYLYLTFITSMYYSSHVFFSCLLCTCTSWFKDMRSTTNITIS